MKEGRANGQQKDDEEYLKEKMEPFRQKRKTKVIGKEEVASIFSNEEPCPLSHPELLSNPRMVAGD